MFRHIQILVLIGISTTALAAQQSALPKRIQAQYSVSKDGEVVAKVTELYEVTGNAYKIQSTTKGIGVYALLGTRKLTSTGKVTATGLKPNRFEFRQSTSAKKTLLTDFDWANNTLNMTVKGEVRQVPLAAGTQDLASFPYQFMFLPKPPKESTTVTLTTGKKLNVYQYKNNEPIGTLNVDGVAYKTVHLVPSDQAKDQIETKELWLAANQNYLLVRLLMVDEHGEKYEQTLTDLHVD